MVIILCDDTTAALAARRTIRCLYRQALDVPDRRIPTIVAWAKPCVDAFCHELADHLGAGRPQAEGATSISHAIHVVHLVHSTAFIAFDIFLADCPPAVRDDVIGQIEQPIYFVFVKTGQRTAYIERRARLDTQVRDRFEHIRALDKGPPRLISDGTYAPTYVNGRRIEREDQAAFWEAWVKEAKAKEERQKREMEEEEKRKGWKEMGEMGENREERKADNVREEDGSISSN